MDWPIWSAQRDFGAGSGPHDLFRAAGDSVRT